MSEPAPTPRRPPRWRSRGRSQWRSEAIAAARRQSALAVFAVGLAAIAVVLVVVLSRTDLRRAGYNLTAVQGEVGMLPPGASGCQPEPLSAGTRAVVVHGVPLAVGRVAVRIRIAGAGRFDGTGASGAVVSGNVQTSGFEVPLPHGPPPARLAGTGALVTMCLINAGDVPLGLFGSSTGADQMVITAAGAPPTTTLGRVRVDDLLSARPESLWGVLPLLSDRIEAASGSALAPWLVGGGAILALLAIGGLLRGGERRRTRVEVAWVVALTLATGALWAGITPAFSKTDEPAHIAYVQAIASFGHPPLILNTPSGGSAQLGCWIRILDAGRPFGPDETVTWTPALSAFDQECDPLSDRYDGAGYQSTQPPAYYLMAAGAYELAVGASLPTRVLAVRLFSVLLAAIAVALTYLLVREVVPGSRWTARAAALALALQPIFMFNESAVNSDALVVAVAAAIAYVAARAWRRGLNRWRVLAFGALTGLGIWSKLNFLTLVPSVALLGAALWWGSFARGSGRERALGAVRLATGALVAVGMYGLYVLINNDVWHRGAAGQGASLVTSATSETGGLRRLGDYVWQFFLPRLPGRPTLFPSYYPLWNDVLKGVTTRLGWWNDFGFDGWAPALVVIGFLIVALAGVYVLPRARRRPWPLLVALAAVALFLVALVVADFRVLASLGDGFEGRYVFPAMPVWGLVVGCAVAALPRRYRPATTGLLAALFLAHTVIAISTTTSAYYL